MKSCNETNYHGNKCKYRSLSRVHLLCFSLYFLMLLLVHMKISPQQSVLASHFIQLLSHQLILYNQSIVVFQRVCQSLVLHSKFLNVIYRLRQCGAFALRGDIIKKTFKIKATEDVLKTYARTDARKTKLIVGDCEESHTIMIGSTHVTCVSLKPLSQKYVKNRVHSPLKESQLSIFPICLTVFLRQKEIANLLSPHITEYRSTLLLSSKKIRQAKATQWTILCRCSNVFMYTTELKES